MVDKYMFEYLYIFLSYNLFIYILIFFYKKCSRYVYFRINSFCYSQKNNANRAYYLKARGIVAINYYPYILLLIKIKKKMINTNLDSNTIAIAI